MGNSSSSSNFEKHSNSKKYDLIVDGGYLVTQGVYPIEDQDFDKLIVSKLIMEKKLAPFYKGLEDQPDDECEHTTSDFFLNKLSTSLPNVSHNLHLESSHLDKPNLNNNNLEKKSSTASFRDQFAQTLKGRRASSIMNFTTSNQTSLNSQNNNNNTCNKKMEEVNGTGNENKFIHSNLYRGAVECPICFLFYPRNINFTRCCDQPICSECFVQIKRSDLNLDPSSCPYCVEPNFGVIYAAIGSNVYINRYGVEASNLPFSIPIPFNKSRTECSGLSSDCKMEETNNTEIHNELSQPNSFHSTSDVKFDDANGAASDLQVKTVNGLEVNIPSKFKSFDRKRRKSLSHKNESVVTSDEIRPTWIKKQQDAEITRQLQINQRSRLAISLASSQARGRDISGELAAAANAAASLVENLTENGLDFFTESNATGRRRNQAVGSGERYLNAMRLMGGDLEELMLMEAMRRSMQDSSTENNLENNSTGATAGQVQSSA
ncbi:SNF1-interacting protein [Lobulomyces angularis]|nr:SNF1-interacting protein [Lobulomyces angularis]